MTDSPLGIFDRTTGADITFSSITIAILFPMFAPVTLDQTLAPSLFIVIVTSGLPAVVGFNPLPILTSALVITEPVNSGSFLTK